MILGFILPAVSVEPRGWVFCVTTVLITTLLGISMRTVREFVDGCRVALQDAIEGSASCFLGDLFRIDAPPIFEGVGERDSIQLFFNGSIQWFCRNGGSGF